MVLLSVGVAQGRSPRPLGTFATAVSDEKKEDAAEEAFSPEQGKQMESIKSIMKAATQEVNIDHNLLHQIYLLSFVYYKGKGGQKTSLIDKQDEILPDKEVFP